MRISDWSSDVCSSDLEVVALAQAAAESGGGYVAHMRSEADRFLEALDETIDVARATGQRAEAYHLKAAGEKNWPKMARAIAMVDAARAAGLDVKTGRASGRERGCWCV